MTEIKEGYLPFGQYRTYYRIAGKNFDQKPPLILLHGGPGSTHNYFEVLDCVADKTNRQVIMYDQLGCGRSSLPDETPEVYNASIWMKELQNLREQLHVSEFHILGQSWGGMLALLYMLDGDARGAKSLILSSTLSSASLWAKELHRMIKFMDERDQEAIKQAESTGDFTSPEYLAANERFMELHSCAKITSDAPEPLRRKKIGGKRAYLEAWGPNEYNPQGNLHSYEVTDRLNEISVPTLITSGTDDLCTPLVAKTMYDRIENARWELFAGCRHMSFVQENEKYVELLCKWLNEND